MRIVITKNGRILIQEINPEVKYKSLLKSQRSINIKKSFNKSITFNNISNIKTTRYGNSTKNIFNPKKKTKNIVLDDVLSEFNSSNNSKPFCKVLNLDPNKNLNMPQSIAERYFTTQINSNNDNEEKNLLPDVLISINKSIEKDANKKGLDYIYKNINSLQTMKENKNDKMFLINSERDELGRYTTTFNLPNILPSYPLKYIISPKSMKNLKKQASKMDLDKLTDNRLTEDNFRSHTKNDTKTNLTLSLKNEINAENTNLITYLNKDKDIRVPFIERISRFDEDKLRRLNKISQKTMFVQSQEKLINERIKDKLRAQFRNSSEKYKEGLESIKNKLFKSEKIIIAEEKKIIDKKERYVNQYNEAELNWVKSGVLRFYHKSKPPVNSATALVFDK